MKMNLNAVLAAALSVLAVGGVQAAIDQPTAASKGDGTLLFVAHNPTDQITLIVDLGMNMSQVIPGSALLSSSANTINWNFGTDAVTTNVAGLSITGNAWSTAYASFAGVTSASEFTWGVIAADSIGGATVTASNALIGRGWVATGNASIAQMTAASTSAPTGNGLTALNNFYAHANNQGNIITAGNGAGIATSGTSFGALGGNLLGFNTWNYMLANGARSTMQYQQQVIANPYVFQLGAGASLDNTFNSSPLEFTFDIGTGALVAAVPEPGTYALMLAGLAGIVFLARRRQR